MKTPMAERGRWGTVSKGVGCGLAAFGGYLSKAALERANKHRLQRAPSRSFRTLSSLLKLTPKSIVNLKHPEQTRNNIMRTTVNTVAPRLAQTADY